MIEIVVSPKLKLCMHRLRHHANMPLQDARVVIYYTPTTQSSATTIDGLFVANGCMDKFLGRGMELETAKDMVLLHCVKPMGANSIAICLLSLVSVRNLLETARIVYFTGTVDI